MKSASAQSRAESALVMFELKEQNSRLKEENSLLLGERGDTDSIVHACYVV